MTERSPDWYTESGGERVDLNDPATYRRGWFQENADYNADDLRDKVQHEIGFSLYYMICCHPGWDRDQYNRVLGFGNWFAREVREPDRFQNVEWLRKQLFLILDEVENQC